MALLQQLAQSDAAMDIITTLAWVIGSISFIVFIALFGRLPAFRKTPIGWTHRLLMVHTPNALIRIDGVLTGGRITKNALSLYDYLMHDRHPVVMIIFVLLQSGSEILFIPPASRFLSSSNKFGLLPVLMALPYFTLYKSYSTSGHHITASTYENALRRYPYDYTLYHPHQACRTCNRPKPARSKHCPICKTCVERQDHHCIWINNCVGLHNYHWFIALLISTACLLFYGAYTGLGIMNKILQNAFPPKSSYPSVTSWSAGLSWTEWLNVCSIAIASNARIGAVSLLACMTFPLAVAFLVYHIYLIWAGTTTNETAKWSDMREDIWDRLVWRAKIEDVKTEYPGPLDERIVYDAKHYRDQSSMRGRAPTWASGRKAEWWLIRTKNGAHPTRWQPTMGDRGKSEEVIDKRWTKVGDLKEIDNLYDLGFWENAKDALFRWKFN